MARPDRRDFMLSAGSLAALGALSRLRPVSAEEARLSPKLVRLDAGIEPLVQLIETTPRDRVIEEVAQRVKGGLGYRELLAALLLAGVRNIQPRPNVGFKFHAVLVVNSAHLASLDSPPEYRWLPIFWALDNFKSSQKRNQDEGGWRMGPVDESKLPPAGKMRQAFASAMENWDEAAADVAAARIARSMGLNEAFDLFARYGCRDFRDIGHKAIYVANAFRTLHVIGPQHAEPVLRSLAYALLRHEGENPAKRNGEPDRCGRENAERLTKIREGWQDGKLDAGATKALLATLREGKEADACQQTVELLNQGISPQSIWDALLLGGGELLMRQPGIVGLHTLTTANALRHAFDICGDDSTRRLLMLQCAAFLPQFLGAMKGRGTVADAQVDQLKPTPAKAEATPDWVFDDVGRNREAAAGKTLAYLASGGSARTLIDKARVLIFLKGTDSHDYKFSSAVLEDYEHVSPNLRDPFLAASTYWLKGNSARDSALVTRIRDALKA